MLIDTHSHLYLPEFSADIQDVILRASQAGIGEIYLPNIDLASIDPMIAVEQAFPGTCRAMIGLHPCSVGIQVKDDLQVIADWLDKRSFIGMGEIGLDKHWDRTYLDQQRYALAFQLDLAKQFHIPVSLHTRDATSECVEMVANSQDGNLTGVFHCFSGTLEQARRIIDLGLYLGIGGVVTFRNAGLDKLLKDVPLENLVLETDSPYLAPVPHRGKRNESAHLALIAEKVASIKQLPFDETAAITTANALRIFKSPVK